MIDNPEITHIHSLEDEKLLGDLVCRYTNPERPGRVEDVLLGHQCTVRWLDSDTREILRMRDLKKIAGGNWLMEWDDITLNYALAGMGERKLKRERERWAKGNGPPPTPRFGAFDGHAARFTDIEAWILVDGKWQQIAPSEMLRTTAWLTEEDYGQAFRVVPPLPKTAFHSGK